MGGACFDVMVDLSLFLIFERDRNDRSLNSVKLQHVVHNNHQNKFQVCVHTHLDLFSYVKIHLMTLITHHNHFYQDLLFLCWLFFKRTANNKSIPASETTKNEKKK